MLIHEKLGIYQVKQPLPFRLNHINCYAIKGQLGWYLVDTGLNEDINRQVWQQFMSDHDIKNKDIQAIYLTHFHIDHFGAAGWLQSFTSAPVFLSALDQEAILQNFQATNPKAVLVFKDMFHRWGVPSAVIDELSKTMISTSGKTLPYPQLKTIEPGSIVQLGDYSFHALLTPGHSEGHICLLNYDYGVLLSGDHLLQKISSNISLMPNSDQDPLASYLKTLGNNLQLPIKLVLPGHGHPFTNVEQRIHELRLHHEDRLRLINGLVDRDDTVYSISKKVFGKGLSLHETRFAISEIAAHLIYLVNRCQLDLTEREGILFFSNSK